MTFSDRQWDNSQVTSGNLGGGSSSLAAWQTGVKGFLA